MDRSDQERKQRFADWLDAGMPPRRSLRWYEIAGGALLWVAGMWALFWPQLMAVWRWL